jgi:hypothetical protein
MKLLTDYIRAAFAGIWVQTYEPDEAHREIAAIAEEQKWTVAAWDVARGMHGNGNAGQGDPLYPLKLVQHGTTPRLVILWNYHRFLNQPMVIQNLFNCVIAGKQSRDFYIVLSHSTQLPPELDKVFVVLEHELPDAHALATIANECEDGEHTYTSSMPPILAAAGLTRYEAEGSFALSLARHGHLQPDEVWELKRSMLKKSGLLEMHRGDNSFTDVLGADEWKQFCRDVMQPSGDPELRALGTLLLGPSGTGKSALCKALGKETGRPMVRLLTDKLKTSGYGDTEQRMGQVLRTVDAMAPCIFMADEIDKLFAGAGRKGDPGATLAALGVLLEWLNDHTSDVFTVMTCNDISEMPPEFSRAERFDGTFFIDLPTEPERAAIRDLYMRKYQLPPQDLPDDTNWTGAEWKACCRLARLRRIPLANAGQFIIPVASSSADKVSALREWASGRCLSASHPGIYNHNRTHAAPKGRRSIAKAT